MSAAEHAYVGPDVYGRTFKAEPCLHVAWWQEEQRLAKIRRQAQARFRPVARPVDAADAEKFPEINGAAETARKLRAQWPWRNV